MNTMPLQAAASLTAAAYSGSKGACQRLAALIAPDRKCGIHPTKAGAANYARTFSGAKLKDATAAVELAIDGFQVRKKQTVGDKLGRGLPAHLAAGASGKLPWASAFRMAGTIQVRLGIYRALVELTDSMEYSGETRRSVAIGWSVDAGTETEKGESYSRKCTHRKTDALHAIRQTPQAVLRLSKAVAAGLPVAMAGMIHLDATEVGPNRYRVRVARHGRGKTLDTASMLVQLMAEGDWFHADTEKTIAKEVRRRAQAVAGHDKIKALFGKKSITIAACRRLGWCETGIRSWVLRWLPDAESLLEARKAPRAVVREAAARAAETGDVYGAKLLALVA